MLRMDQRSLLSWQHPLKRERPMCTERKMLIEECGWKYGGLKAALFINTEERCFELTSGKLVVLPPEPPMPVKPMPERCSRARIRFAAQSWRPCPVRAFLAHLAPREGGSGGKHLSKFL